MERVQIEKDSIQEELIIPLYRKKMCIEKFPTLFQDDKALELLSRMDYDFSEVEKIESKKGRQFDTMEAAIRYNDIVTEIEKFLKNNPYASIVNIGCGLDQTAEKCDNGTCQIYNLDRPDIMEFRNQLLPETDRIHNLDYDLMDLAWFDEIEAEQGVLFFASGVFSKIKREDIKKLFNEMALRFPGCRLVFDSMGKVALKMKLKSWATENKIENLEDYFYVDDTRWDIRPWIKNAKLSEKSYMKAYGNMKEEALSKSYRFYAKLADKSFKLKIVIIDFANRRN